MKLSRKQVFWVGTIAIVLFYFVNRGRILFSSTITAGTVATVKLAKATKNGAATANPAILFSDKNNQRYLFWGYENETMLAIGDTVKVIYEDDEPGQASIYSTSAFWFETAIYFVVPFVVWAAFVLSFIEADGKITLRLKLFEKKQNDDLRIE
jgi:hypothetical protein